MKMKTSSCTQNFRQMMRKNYDELKAEILRQAKEYGYTKKKILHFGMINKKSSDKNAAFLYVKSTFTFCFVRGII